MTIDETSKVVPLPAGDYAIVELFGHVTLVGRISEVEKFGIKMLAIEPLFCDQLLGVVFHGGASIYRLTPCEAEHARKCQPRQEYQLPPSIRQIVPPLLLEATQAERYHDVDPDEDEKDEIPF